MRRNDLRGRHAPSWLQAMIVRRYGKSPFGEPRFRLVWAPARFEQSGGEWTDWESSTRATEHGQAGSHPVRRVVEMRWTRKYPGEEAWLIERWLPASSFGSPDQWYRTVAEGGTVLPCGIAGCGDYPQFGDYEDIGARMHWYPTERHVTTAIDAVERQREAAPGNGFARVRERTTRAEAAQEQRDREYDRWTTDVLDDGCPAFGGAPMIGYGGSHRPSLVTMAERIGIRQHPL